MNVFDLIYIYVYSWLYGLQKEVGTFTSRSISNNSNKMKTNLTNENRVL